MAHTHPSITSSESAVESVEQALVHFFHTQTEAAQHISPYYATLWRHMSELVLSGGKRLRPRMTLLSYEAFGGMNMQAVVPIATALELLHASLLMHDDIIDRDYTRYGIDNVAGSYRHEYENLVQDEAERTHYANGAALLGGDLLLSGAYQLVSQSPLSFEERAVALQLLNETIFHVAAGELLDTESAFRAHGEVSAELVAVHKTASYTFVTPLVLGATLAGIASEQKVLLRIFAETLGVAFQLQDDLLGVFGDTALTGKTTIGDLREGKRTYMVERFFALVTPQQKQLFLQWFGDEAITILQAETLRDLLQTSGAYHATETAIESYVHRARQALGELDIADSYRQQFEALIDKAVRRHK